MLRLIFDTGFGDLIGKSIERSDYVSQLNNSDNHRTVNKNVSLSCKPYPVETSELEEVSLADQLDMTESLRHAILHPANRASRTKITRFIARACKRSPNNHQTA